jgi:hypothetical protein
MPEADLERRVSSYPLFIHCDMREEERMTYSWVKVRGGGVS